uniref:Uncharacterized protein n=1 Tax=Amphimedon queenslandica TaxID=400682 RepID=A0A1X7UN37_AMPQE
MVTSVDATKKLIMKSLVLQTRETYSCHSSFLKCPLQNHAVKTYGIARESISTNSKYFHVVDGLVLDVMHDVLEGCVPYMVKELLKYLISQHIISLEELNNQIESFPYSKLDVRNRPTVIPSAVMNSSDHSVEQNVWAFNQVLVTIMGTHTIGVLQGAENYKSMKNHLALLIDEIKVSIEERFIKIDSQCYELNFVIGGDYKYSLLVYGINAANANYTCLFCHIKKDRRYDTSVTAGHCPKIIVATISRCLTSSDNLDSLHKSLFDIKIDKGTDRKEAPAEITTTH